MEAPVSTPTADALRETVRARYADAARAAAAGSTATCGCGAGGGCGASAGLVAPDHAERFGAGRYGGADTGTLPDAAALASLGCGNPTAVDHLHPGETVLDLGSGGGLDVLLSARRVGPAGTAYGLDMTDEMLDLARRNQAEAGLANVVWLRGHIEAIPLPAASVDVVISNCVINLSTDKPAALAEATRVLRPGGRLAFTDVIADPDMDAATRADVDAYTGCIAGALTHHEMAALLTAAGLTDAEITETHRVHAHAGSAIIRARKPAGAAACCALAERTSCCEPDEKDACCGDGSPGGCGCR
jgi:SAM-dependent methyltransferase